MSSYYQYRSPEPRRPRSATWPAVLLIILIAVLGVLALDQGFGWRLFRRAPDLKGSFEPRLVVARGDFSSDEQATIAVYERNAPSVVHINNLAEHENFLTWDVQQIPRGSGSGFVWDDNGIIVTNAHVVQGADTVEVILPDKAQTRYVTRDWVAYPDKDIAVIYVDAPKDKLRKIPAIGTSSDLKVGQKTYAIGNPFGLDQTLTTGIVSALNREIKADSGRSIEKVIQTSAPINPGNSGGPLLDAEGRVIGVNTAILSPSGTFAGIGFAIPIDEVNQVVPTLIARLNENIQNKSGPMTVRPPRLGVTLAPEQYARSQGIDGGALILRVEPRSPAAEAGLRPTRRDSSRGTVLLGDVILSIDDKPVKSPSDISAILEGRQYGEKIVVQVLRGRRQMGVEVTLTPLR